jgi:hypothetical protein
VAVLKCDWARVYMVTKAREDDIPHVNPFSMVMMITTRKNKCLWSRAKEGDAHAIIIPPTKKNKKMFCSFFSIFSLFENLNPIKSHMEKRARKSIMLAKKGPGPSIIISVTLLSEKST